MMTMNNPQTDPERPDCPPDAPLEMTGPNRMNGLHNRVVTTPENPMPQVPNTPGNSLPSTTRVVTTLSLQPPESTRSPMTLMPSSEAVPDTVIRMAEERLLFLRKVQETKHLEPRLTDPQAVMMTAARWPNLFPILTTSGQHGSSQLTYQNYRNWMRRIRGIPEPDQLTALRVNYKRGWSDPVDGYPEFYKLFNRIWLSPNKQSVAESWRNTRDTLARIDPQAKIPSKASVHYYIAHLSKEAVILAREGEVAWRNRCCDYADRDWSGILPGQMIVGDSRPFDTRVKVWDGSAWIPVRPTLTALMDAKSWRFVSWMITTAPVCTDDQIRLLAQYCCITGGYAPLEAYFDNGKDYKAQGFSTPMTLAGHDYSIFAALGIRLTHARPYNGRAKTIEPNFKNVMQRFDKKFPDYLGSNPLERPDAAALHEKNPELLPDLTTFTRIFAAWLDAYHQNPKNGIILQGKSPEEVWNARQPGSRRRSASELAEAFMRPFGIRQIGRGGRISVSDTTFITNDVRFGEKVIVKTDPFHSDRIGLYDLNGGRLGAAFIRESVAALAKDDEYEQRKLSDRIARQKAQERAVKLLALDLKGGRQSASPLEEMLTAGKDTRMVTVATIHTVKGQNHVFKRIAPADDVFAPDPPQENSVVTTLPAHLISHRSSVSGRELEDAAEVSAALARKDNPESEEDLSEIYDFIHKKQQGDNDEL